MSQRGRGRPKKRQRNTTGLRNQSDRPSSPDAAAMDVRATSQGPPSLPFEDWDPVKVTAPSFGLTHDDSLKILLSWFEHIDDEDDEEDEDVGLVLSELEGDEGGLDMMRMVLDNDPRDLDWLPAHKRQRVQEQIPGTSEC